MELYPYLWLIVAAISVVPMIVFWKGYFRLGAPKLRLTAIAFTLFFAKALAVSTELFLSDADEETWFLNDEFWLSVAAILDMIIISLIVIGLKATNGVEKENGEETAQRNASEESTSMVEDRIITAEQNVNETEETPRPFQE